MQPSRYLYDGGYTGTLDVGNANSLITVISTIPRHKSLYRGSCSRRNGRSVCSSKCWNLSRMNNLLFQKVGGKRGYQRRRGSFVK